MRSWLHAKAEQGRRKEEEDRTIQERQRLGYWTVEERARLYRRRQITPPQTPLPQHQPQTQHHPGQSAPWTQDEDNFLIDLKDSGLGWSEIHQKFFPKKSGNACRKRHERLMVQLRTTDWDDQRIRRVMNEYNAPGVPQPSYIQIARRLGERWEDVERVINAQLYARSALEECGSQDVTAASGASLNDGDIDDTGLLARSHGPMQESQAWWYNSQPQVTVAISSQDVSSQGGFGLDFTDDNDNLRTSMEGLEFAPERLENLHGATGRDELGSKLGRHSPHGNCTKCDTVDWYPPDDDGMAVAGLPQTSETIPRPSNPPSRNDWTNFKNTIIELYMGRKMLLHELVPHMELHHAFKASSVMIQMLFSALADSLQ